MCKGMSLPLMAAGWHGNLSMKRVLGYLGTFLFSTGMLAAIYSAPVLAQPLGQNQANAEQAPVCRGSDGYAADFGGRRTFLWRPQWLEAIKSNPTQSAAIIAEAGKSLRDGPYSVTDKVASVPGAASNDYTSIGPYWWPDPTKADGLPYIRRDGEFNPQRNGPEFDKMRLRSLGRDLKALSLAYFLTSDERYADHAATLIRVWFIDPQTRMAPHMNFAQGIPGKVSGRAEGIIESSDLSTVVESIGLLTKSSALSGTEHDAVRQWYADFSAWMTTSEIGKAEKQKRNNHGVFYDFYLAHFAIFAGIEETAKSTVAGFPENRLKVQMDRDGRFHQELTRTRSWHYSNYVVGAAARLATIGECVGLDLWSAQLDDGRSLSDARNFLSGYARQPANWPFPERDHKAGSFEKMQSTFAHTDFLFQRPNSVKGTIDLP